MLPTIRRTEMIGGPRAASAAFDVRAIDEKLTMLHDSQHGIGQNPTPSC